MHRPDPQAVGHDFRAHAPRAVVDHERVARRLKHMPHHRVGPVAGEGLGGGHFIGELRGKVAECFQTVGQCGVALVDAFQRVGRTREAAVRVWPHDNGVGLAVENFIAVDHGNDRLAGLALADPRLSLRVSGLVIDDRLAGGGTAGGGQAHFFFGQGVAEGSPTFGDDHHLAKQAIGDVTCPTLAAKSSALTGGSKGPLALGVQGVAAGVAGRYQEVAIAAGVGGDIANAVDRLHAVHLEADMPVIHLLISDEILTAFVLDFVLRAFLFAFLFAFGFVFFRIDAVLVGVGLVGQQVGQVDREAVTGGYPQHNRPWALVRAQGDLARYRGPALAEGDLLVVHHVLTKGKHHAVGVLRAKAVEHQWLVQCHHIGNQGALALHSCLAGRFPAKQGQEE
ncbi:hypothetical protein D3C79_664720 [compost metagenome]